MIAGLLALVGMAGASLSAVPYLGAVLSFLGTRAGRAVLFGLGLTVIVGVAYHKGEAAGDARCDSRALSARLAELQTQLKDANGRADRAASVIADLQQADAKASEREAMLRDEVAKAKLQSTIKGAKPDANAILDDRCNLTPLGARRMRGG
jgi:hypothetical protein